MLKIKLIPKPYKMGIWFSENNRRKPNNPLEIVGQARSRSN